MNWKKSAFKNFKLYAVTDIRDEDPEILKKVEAAYRGGADIVQLRSKTLSDAALYRIGIQWRKIADRLRKLFFVNDRVELALRVEADGLHLGQDDLSLEELRKIVAGRQLFVGRSTHSLEQALRGGEEGVDYIGVGPIFETPTKPAYKPVGLELIQEVKKRVQIPFVCIGGINPTNVREVVEAGGSRVAVVRAIFEAQDVLAATRELRQALEESTKQKLESVK